MASSRLAALALLITPIAPQPVDLPSLCKGYCQIRYQDGTYLNGQCACIDYFHTPRSRVPAPVLINKKPEEPHTYDGEDQIHYSKDDEVIDDKP